MGGGEEMAECDKCGEGEKEGDNSQKSLSSPGLFAVYTLPLSLIFAFHEAS